MYCQLIQTSEVLAVGTAVYVQAAAGFQNIILTDKCSMDCTLETQAATMSIHKFVGGGGKTLKLILRLSREL